MSRVASGTKQSDAYLKINKANYTIAGYKVNLPWHYLLAGALHHRTRAVGGESNCHITQLKSGFNSNTVSTA